MRTLIKTNRVDMRSHRIGSLKNRIPLPHQSKHSMRDYPSFDCENIPARQVERIRMFALVTFWILGACIANATAITGIQGGTFESATDRGYWTTGYYTGGSSSSSGILQNSNRASSGSWYAYVGDVNSTTFPSWGYLQQYLSSAQIFNPGYIKSLDISFDLNISSDEGTTTAYDYMTNSIFYFDANTGQLLFQQDVAWFSNKDKSAGTGPSYYVRKSYNVLMPDLPACYAYIIWKAKTDNSAYTVFRLDNISVSMNKWTYIVNSSVVGAHGSINPLGSTTVDSGSDLPFNATPDPNWGVDQWYVDGTSVQTGGSSYTLKNIMATHSVTVSFKQLQYGLSVSITKGQGSYTLDPPGGQYSAGTVVTATATAGVGYQPHEWGGAGYSLNNQVTITKGAKEETLYIDFVPLPVAPSASTAHTTPSTININTQPQSDWLTIFEVAPVGTANPAWIPFKLATTSDSTLQLQCQATILGQVCRLVRFPVVHVPSFLTFPLHGTSYGGASALTHEVISIMDHNQIYWSVDSPEYVRDDVILTYLGEEFDITSQNRLERTSMSFAGFTRQPVFKYTGDKTYGAGVLNYDAHPGYDYRCDDNTPVYAAAPGTLVTYADPMWAVIKKYAQYYHAVILDHGNGFRTVYMHLTSSPLMVTTTDWWDPKTGTDPVTTNTIIGYSGHFLRNTDGSINTNLGPHLHFEVWMQVGSSWVLHDPYGAYTKDSSQIYGGAWQ